MVPESNVGIVKAGMVQDQDSRIFLAHHVGERYSIGSTGDVVEIFF